MGTVSIDNSKNISQPIDIPFLFRINTSTVAVSPSVGDRTVELAAGHGTVVGNVLEVAEPGTGTFIQSEVLNVASNTITLDQPVNFPYSVGAPVNISSADLLVDGSSTPVVFTIDPSPAQRGNIIRIILEMRSENEMDFSTFGGEPPITNGCVLRIKQQGGTFVNLYNWKTNGEFARRCYDYFSQAKTGGTENSIVARSTYGGDSRRGTFVRLDGNRDEELQIVIQDDLTLSGATKNTLFRLIAQGHELQETS